MTATKHILRDDPTPPVRYHPCNLFMVYIYYLFYDTVLKIVTGGVDLRDSVREAEQSRRCLVISHSAMSSLSDNKS